MSTGRVALRVFLAGAVLKMLLIRQAESGNRPGVTNAILTFDPLATWIAKGSEGSPQAYNLILVAVFGLECVLLFFGVRWLLQRRQR